MVLALNLYKSSQRVSEKCKSPSSPPTPNAVAVMIGFVDTVLWFDILY